MAREEKLQEHEKITWQGKFCDYIAKTLSMVKSSPGWDNPENEFRGSSRAKIRSELFLSREESAILSIPSRCGRGDWFRRLRHGLALTRTAGNPLIIMADSTKIIPRNDHVALRHRILDGLDKLTDLTEVHRTAPPSGPENHRSLSRFDFHALPKGDLQIYSKRDSRI